MPLRCLSAKEELVPVSGPEGEQNWELSLAIPSDQTPDNGLLVYLLNDGGGRVYIGDGGGLHDLGDEYQLGQRGNFLSASGFRILNAKEINRRSSELRKCFVPIGGEDALSNVGISRARLFSITSGR